VLSFATPESERCITDADDEGIPAGSSLGEDFHLLAAAKAEFEQPAVEQSELFGTGAHAHDYAGRSGRQGAQADVSRLQRNTRRRDDCVHEPSI
jgi:hypothetical protein